MSSQLLTELENFDFDNEDDSLVIESACFRIKRKKKYYIVTSHNFLPVKNVFFDSEKLKICINCIWNEFLILKEDNPLENIKKNNIFTFENFATKLPPIGTSVSVGGKKYSIKNFVFTKLANIKDYPLELYLQIEIKNAKKIKIGTPIYSTQKKFQGMVSLHDDEHIYCVPSYYLIKTFQKDNSFKIPNVNDVGKINRHIVKDNLVFSPFLGLNIPISTFLFLENNRNLQIYENKDGCDFKILKEIDKRDVDSIVNKRKLVSVDGFYQLSSCSYHLLRWSNFAKFLSQINSELINGNFDFRFKIENDELFLK